MAASIGSKPAARQLVEGLLRISNSHRAARLAYHPGRHTAPVVLFQAEDDRKAGPDWAQFWRETAGGAFETQVVPGDHVTIMAQPHVEILAEALKASLRQRKRSRTSAV